MPDIVQDTAVKLQCDPSVLFRKAALQKFPNSTSVEDIASFRYKMWMNCGDIPPWMSDYCLSHWRRVKLRA